MRIPQDIIDKVASETNLVELISESVSLKKAGAHFKGLCPFHGEKTPSFVVSPQKGIFHCFGCGEGGGAIQFLMKQKHLSFREAVERLANALGLHIPQNQSSDPAQEKKQRLYKINQYALWFFQNEYKAHKVAQTYFLNRGFLPKTIDYFQLGYALDSYNALHDFLKAKKVPLTEAIELGLLKTSAQNQNRPYDFYRDRLIFPIHDASGRVIGFGGRALNPSDKQAKYINSSESLVYHKSSELYGFYENKEALLKKGQVIVVEGYTDVLALWQLDCPLAVAPLGTSLTRFQIQRLKRYQLEVILMFDGDAAGQAAAEKAIELCFSEEIHPKVVVLPKGQDPADALKDPTLKIHQSIEDAPYALDWLILSLYQKSGSSPTNISQSLQKIRAWIEKLPQGIPPEPFEQKASQYFGMSIKSVNKVIEKPSRFAMANPPKNIRLTLEEILVLLFWRQPQKFGVAEFKKVSLTFENKTLTELVDLILDILKNHETFNPTQAINNPQEGIQRLLVKLLAQEELYKDYDEKDCLKRYNLGYQKRRLKELTAQIAQAELENKQMLKLKLLNEKQNLMKASQK